MQRKVNRVGQNTLTVSLPASWAKKYKVNAGDELLVNEEANTLIVSTSLALKNKSVSLDISNKDDFLTRVIIGAYIKGYDKIIINFRDQEVFLLVQDVVNRLMTGFEIVEHDRNRCVIENITGEGHIDIDTYLRKYFLQVLRVVESLSDAIAKKNVGQLDYVLNVDKSIDKLCHFMKRILTTKGYKNDIKGKSLYYIIQTLENISDDCRDLCKLIKEKGFPGRKFSILFRKAFECLELYYDLYYSFDIVKIKDFKRKSNEIKNGAFVEMDKGKDIRFYYYLMSVVKLDNTMAEELWD